MAYYVGNTLEGRETSLTDGSPVYAVELDHGRYSFDAVTYSDAKELCAKIAAALEAHTNLDVFSGH